MAPILYCGDTNLETAASYLAGMMASWGWEFDYVPSDQPITPDEMQPRDLVILSDYPADQMNDAAQTALLSSVEAGTGLIMIGGWESFHGFGGDWDRTKIADALPVTLQTEDDRINCDQSALVRVLQNHPAVDGLPWQDRPPCIGGFNRFHAKPDAKTLLAADRLQIAIAESEAIEFNVRETHPLLVVGKYGQGQTAALATDVAPHWVGGWVDWGDGRVQGQADGAEAIEVGDSYAQFWRQLLSSLRRSLPT
ncbi:glutamine amidotransferase [Thalassoroseus pseudoceratinae]|uniref:glutamine amidotransferase n=1 Tax=Thalassoroseus pseudoceratinae TaxID=2713176 RepID=UPI00142288B0|nr:glutamine amidotransferase [Thalassoroseus pseudoceratinae]